MKNILKGRDFIREKVRLRDRRTCQKCSKKWVEGMRRFDIHHIKPEQEGRRDYEKDFRYLITYCHKCHMTLHTVVNKMAKGHIGVIHPSKELVKKRFQMIKKLLEKDITQREIAKLVGITYQSLNNNYIKKITMENKSEKYSQQWFKDKGKLGGDKTFKLYGREHYSLIRKKKGDNPDEEKTKSKTPNKQ